MRYGKITVDPAISSEIGEALALIEVTDPTLSAQMLNTEWEVQSCDDDGDGDPMGCLSLFLTGALMGTQPSRKTTIASFDAIRHDMGSLHIPFDHALAAVLVHEWVHLFQDDLTDDELTPAQCALEFASKLGDEKLVKLTRALLKGIDPNGEWNSTKVHNAVVTEFGLPKT